MSSNNNSIDQWDERFLLEFEDGTVRKVHAKFIGAAENDRRTSDMIALNSKSEPKRVTNIRMIPPRYR